MRALITGINGQDGGYLADALLAEGYEVHGLSRHPPANHQVHSHLGDIGDPAVVREVVAQVGPHEIYHLAAISSVHRSWQEPELTMRVNGSGTVSLLDAAMLLHQQGHRPRVVNASSAEIFGQATHSPQDEATPLAPVSPYGVAKAYAHRMAQVYRNRGLGVSNLILYSHESPRRGAQFVTRKIAAGVVDIARGRRHSLTLGNLDAVRDWGWAPDYTDAMIRSARSDAPDDFVIATGEGHRVRDFVAEAFRAVAIDDWQTYVQSDPGLTRPADPVAQVGTPAKAETLLGWRRTRDFPEIVAAMVLAERDRANSR